VGTCGGDYFPNGVAAGDVDQSSVVLWARAEFAGPVTFEYGRDPDFFGAPDGVQTVMVADPMEGENLTIPAKVEFLGLDAGTQYYYRACRGEMCPKDCLYSMSLGLESRGSFRTPYAGGHNGLRFGVSSCWRGDMKPFASIRNVPDRNLDFFVALGDTVYADSSRGGRATTLSAFRTKNELGYSKTVSQDDNYFALARASTAFFVDIDDHEIINNFAGGAPPESQIDTVECKRDLPLIEHYDVCFCDPDNDENGNCDKAFINETDLFKDALQAWYEYNPVREERYGDTRDARTEFKNKLYRNRTFGKDAALFMLDTRSFRDEGAITKTWNPDRTMLGRVQLDDLKRDLQDAENNGITWKFVLVPEPIQNLGLVGLLAAGDRFEGYNHERGILLDFIQSNCIANVVFVSGDIHANIVNNLTYRTSRISLERFSASWDISTGPVAYSSGFDTGGPTGALITRSAPGEPREPLDEEFRKIMDFQLVDHPDTGLEPEFPPTAPLQQENAFIPATLIQGSYVAGHSYGWTEFEIDAATRKLRVTTYGIDWYDAPTGAEYSESELDNILNQEQYVLHKFEVSPRDGCAGCGDGICDSHIPALEKCGGNDTTLLQCTTDCGKCANGELCGDDNMCESGLCSGDIAGVCIFPQENGQLCGKDEGCISGICNFAICVSPQPNGNLCEDDNVCQSGICTITCQACNPAGSLCGSGSSCCSGTCAKGQCKAGAGTCKASGAVCNRDWECCSSHSDACDDKLFSDDICR